MAIFGRMTARQRLRRATRESLSMPAFSSPIDCTPWVIGGIWPAELSTITTENATLAEYLKTDLQRIAANANEQLRMVKRAVLAGLPRQAEEARVIGEARARAAQRVESTIRQLHAKAGATTEQSRPEVAESLVGEMDQTQVIPAVTEAAPLPDWLARSARKPRWRVEERPAPVAPQGGPNEARHEPAANSRHHAEVEETTPLADKPEGARDTGAEDDAARAWMGETQVIPAVTEFEPVVDDADHYYVGEPDAAASMEETQVIPAITDVETVVGEPAEEDVERIAIGRHHVEVAEPARQPEAAAADVAAASMEQTQVIPVVTGVEPSIGQPAEPDWEPVGNGRHHTVPSEPARRQDKPDSHRKPKPATPGRGQRDTAATDFDVARLNRLLEFVVRQEPRLNWAVGDLPDGTTVLVTDLAHGWVPAGITLPAGVRLLEPRCRTGRVAALIGDAARVVAYAPGDSLRRSADFTTTKSSLEPRELPAIDGLSTVLSQTTRRFDGLPRIVRRLADAAAADTVVIDQEVDVLRVHLDTARYQLLVQYPTVNAALLLKCLLMAATEGLASGDRVSANYHLAWYQELAAEALGP